MAEKEKNRAKVDIRISEDDMSNLLPRYSVMTVRTLLQEVANCSDMDKIDWTALASNTLTGITNPREYQMLWRHLVYKHPLIGNVNDGDEPLDDDSDMEASPAVSSEAAAHVKLLPVVAPVEGLDANGTSIGNNLPRKKRKPHSEDAELAAAVEKYGEGNWANIQEFKGIRNSVPLSQRWAHLKRRKSNVLGAEGSTIFTISSGYQKCNICDS